MIAVFVRTLEGWAGDARLYRLSEPVVYCDLADHEKSASFVIVSAVCVLGRPETYIFPATESGGVLSWGELDGSYRGGLDHEEALRGFCDAVEETK